MPILRLNAMGEIVESDASMNGDQGVGRQASYVEADDVESLSNLVDPRETAGRRKIAEERLQKLTRDLKKKYKKMVQSKVNELASTKKAQKNFLRQKSLADQMFLAQTKNKLMALNNSYLPDQHAGVTGYGLSADGRMPDFTHPAYDWTKPVMTPITEEAFGSHMGFTDLKPPASTAEAFGGGHMGQWPKAGFSSVDLPHVKDLTEKKTFGAGEYTQVDEFLINQWENGTWTLPYYYVQGGRTTKYNQVFDESKKDNLHYNNEVQFGQSFVSKQAMKGWQYSGYWENGKFISVKIPFTYGIPMDDPACPGKYDAKKRDAYTKSLYWQDPYRMKVGDEFYKVSRFSMLKPVIKALAKKYAATAPAKERVVTMTPQSTGDEVAKAQTQTTSQNVAMTASQAKALNNYQHPFLKYKVLRGS